MLVHICCSVDSHYFLEQLKLDYPNENIVGFFYNPNIHPYSEYALRYLDVQNSCQKLGIKLIEGDYNLEGWLKRTKGFENEPEKGKRCEICFDDRLEESVKLAKKLNINSFTTTLLMSPLKSQNMLKIVGTNLENKYSCKFIFKDYRSGQGAVLQNLAVKENNLYRQNYCGCLYALMPQRVQQNRLNDELISPLNRQILPQSIEYRYELYKKRDELEQENRTFQIVKNSFLNYRLLQGSIALNNSVVSSYILYYSTLNKSTIKSKVVTKVDSVFYLKDEMKFIELSTFNKSCNTNFNSVKELLKVGISFEQEQELRAKIVQNSLFDLSFIAILDEVIEDCNYTVKLNSVTYKDTKEIILTNLSKESI